MSGDDQWGDITTTEHRLLFHENLKGLVAEANRQKLPFRVFRDTSGARLVETVVLSDIAFQSDGTWVRQGLWDERRLLITGDGTFDLKGLEIA